MVASCASIAYCPLRPLAAASLAFLPYFVFEIAWYLLAFGLAFAVLWILDLGLVQLSRVPFLRQALAFGWTRWTRRYPDPNSLSGLRPRPFCKFSCRRER
jgi:hypothetical protein